ncbi:hypothetical protein J437_LFUL019598, partial [Ladona fulva]
MKVFQLLPNSKLVSFNTVSLFSSVPQSEVFLIIKDMLLLENITNVIIHELLSLCDIFIKTFCYNYCCYVQPDGLVVGSPIFPLLSEIFLNFVESQLFSSKYSAKIWHRYVDVKDNNTTDFSIFYKPTYSLYHTIHQTSNHPIPHKHAAFLSLIHRLINIPLKQSNFSRESHIIKQITVAIGYPVSLID